jgi:hypothetical protein
MAITNPFETDLLLSRSPRMHEKRVTLRSDYVDAIVPSKIVLGSGGFFWSRSTMRILFPPGSLLRSGLFSGFERYTWGPLCVSWQISVRAVLQGLSPLSRQSGSCSIVRVVRESSAHLRHSIDGTRAVTSRMHSNATPEIALEGTSTPYFPVF